IKGLGRGLSVTYGIVKNFNGDIEVTSKEGEGTTFKVTLPVV
ncbi:MAG: ATP-binding protein, partial [Deltaproteobacteria bacterium]